MALSGNTLRDQFDLTAYRDVTNGITALHGKLPEPALRALATEVLLRMGQASRAAPAADAPAGCDDTVLQGTPNSRLDQFCTALIASDPTQAARAIERAQRFGVGIDEIYLAYLTPAARRLGEWWESDDATFAEVTVGIARIYGIMRGLRDALPVNMASGAKHAVFANIPGCDHTLGVSVAADLFRKEGWDIDLLTGLDHDAMVTRLCAMAPPILGLSASGAEHMPALLRLLTALRVHRLPSRVMLSGRIVSEVPEIAAHAGIDGAAQDFETARANVERIWASLHRRGQVAD